MHGSGKRLVCGHSPAAQAEASSPPLLCCQCCPRVLLFFHQKLLRHQTFVQELIAETSSLIISKVNCYHK